MTLLIGISGPMGVGKTTVARFILEYVGGLKLSGIIVPFADELKRIAKDEFGWDGAKDDRGRKLLQVLGTEAGRAYNPNIWIDKWLKHVYSSNWAIAIADDMRFENECRTVKSQGGALVRVEGPSRIAKTGMVDHASEAGLLPGQFHATITNNSTLAELRRKTIDMTQKLMEEFLRRSYDSYGK